MMFTCCHGLQRTPPRDRWPILTLRTGASTIARIRAPGDFQLDASGGSAGFGRADDMSEDPDVCGLLRAIAADAQLGALPRGRFLKAAGALGGVALSGGALAAFLEACASSSGGGSSTNTNATVTMAVFQEPDTLDPSASGLITVGTISHCIFDTLIWDLPGHGANPFYSGLATSWEAAPDATSYTFKLRKDVKFHDGTPFNAQAVKFTFHHIVDPNPKAEPAAGSLGPYQDTQVIDHYTVKVILKSANAAFMNEVAALALGSPTAVQKYGADF